MKAFDFHGYTKEELERAVDQLIGKSRLSNDEQDFELITGEGPLKQHLKKYLTEHYQVEMMELHNSSGTVYVYID